MHGLMQQSELTVDKIADHAARWHGAREIVTRAPEGPIRRTDYATLRTRARQLLGALAGLGIASGDRVATLAWNSDRHLEAWYAIMGMGAVCHTLNPRLHPDQIAWIANDAGDRMLIADIDFLDIVAHLRASCPGIEHVVLLGAREQAPALPAALADALFSEDLVASGSPDTPWRAIDEDQACGLCYTSGTTGNPKGVLYSHRSNLLHTLMTMQADVMGLRTVDTVLPVVPMFHANAWGLAFSAPAAGAKLVLPGNRLDGASLFELIETEGVTFAAGVPTVWQGLLAHLDRTGERPKSLERVLVGGAACPPRMINAFRDRYGIEVVHAWGMTETSPLGTIWAPVSTDQGECAAARLKQGRPPFLIDIAVLDDQGSQLPRDGKSVGRLAIKGPTVARAYFGDPGSLLADRHGLFDTGDIATIDRQGFMQITDRAKDVIKSGGEWISSLEIESLIADHPRVDAVAVVGVPHDRWGERPLLIVQASPGDPVSQQELLAVLDGRIPRWWVPDACVFVEKMPLGSTGKIDKKQLRSTYAEHLRSAAPHAET